MKNYIISEVLGRPDAHLIIKAVKLALNVENEMRSEFLNNISDESRDEFINGEIIRLFPDCLRDNKVYGSLLRLLSIYVMKHQLGYLGSARTMISMTRNAYHPDLSFFKKERSALFANDQRLFPRPDFVIEILSESTKYRDRNVKFKDYQAHNVEEYWIVDPENETLEQYHSNGDEYELILKSGNGTVTSFAISGFQIPIQAIFNEAENLKAIQNL